MKKMKQGKRVFIYKDNEFVKETTSMLKAAMYAGVSQPTVATAIRNNKPTKKGWRFTTEKVEFADEEVIEYNKQEEEIDERFPNYRYVDKNKKRLFVGSQQYEVSSKDKLVTFIPVSKQERKNLLKTLIWKRLEKRWLTIDKRVSTLERQTFTELIDSI